MLFFAFETLDRSLTAKLPGDRRMGTLFGIIKMFNSGITTKDQISGSVALEDTLDLHLGKSQ